MKMLGLVFVLLASSTAFANRCAWNPFWNRAVCCQETQQAIWNPVNNQVACPNSDSGDSCIWNATLNRVQCCADSKGHAVWNPLRNWIECH